MNLRSVKMMMNVLYIACLMTALAGAFLQMYWLLGVAAGLLAGYAVFRYKFWRCPKCNASLERGNRIRCGQCKWELR